MGQTATDAMDAMSRRAEALLRALVGVHHAEVRFRTEGRIVQVRVAAANHSAGLLMRNIRSALLAGLGVAIDPAQIELIEPALWVARESATDGAAPTLPAADVAPADAAPAHGAPAVRIGHGHGHGNGHAPHNGGGNGAATGNGHAAAARPAEPARAPLARADTVLVQPERRRSHAIRERVAPGRSNGAAPAVRVERVELVRHAGRLRCRVVIAAGSERFTAVADGGEEPGAELQLAGRVACDALRAGGLTSAQFESATIAYLAGRVHVVAALGDWQDGEPAPRSGSVVADESLEHAAARAVLHAALGQTAH